MGAYRYCDCGQGLDAPTLQDFIDAEYGTCVCPACGDDRELSKVELLQEIDARFDALVAAAEQLAAACAEAAERGGSTAKLREEQD